METMQLKELPKGAVLQAGFDCTAQRALHEDYITLMQGNLKHGQKISGVCETYLIQWNFSSAKAVAF